ncbi:RNA polymerase II-associated protein 2 [Sarotherodon galilaeus]
MITYKEAITALTADRKSNFWCSLKAQKLPENPPFKGHRFQVQQIHDFTKVCLTTRAPARHNTRQRSIPPILK